MNPDNILDFMLKLHGENNLNKRIYGGMTLLNLAISCNNEEAAEMILDSKYDIDVDIADLSGQTALTRACRQGYLNIVKRLVSMGADIDYQAKDGYTPLMYAAYYGHMDIINLLLDLGADTSIKNAHGMTAFDILCSHHKVPNHGNIHEKTKELLKGS